MSWESSYRRLRYLPRSIEHPAFKINQQCFIRKVHKCGKIFGASKSCFIACPSDPELNPILELMSEKLTKVGIEPIIAIRERAYGQDIFCTKICGKIIEAKFCVVILDDLIVEKKNIPNPNVYYEYGLMTALRKDIIPLQKEKLKLAFNIQSYDTIKYNSSNIATELDRAIKDAIKVSESTDKVEKKISVSEKTILRNLELAGFEIKGDNWFLSDVIEDTEFKGFGQHQEGFYLYLGKIQNQDELQNYLEDLNVVLYRTEKKVEELHQKIEKLRKQKEDLGGEKERAKSEKRFVAIRSFWRRSGDIDTEIKDLEQKLVLMQTMYIGFILESKIDISSFLGQAKTILKKYDRYKLAYNNNGEIKFGKLKISFLPYTT